MGGLVAREYNQSYSKQDGIEIIDIVTIGTPFNGTTMAYLAVLSRAGRQMFPASEFVKKQQDLSAIQEEKTHYLHLASPFDYIIRPVDSAVQGNVMSDRVNIKWLDIPGHLPFLFSDTAIDSIIDYLQQRSESPHSNR